MKIIIVHSLSFLFNRYINKFLQNASAMITCITGSWSGLIPTPVPTPLLSDSDAFLGTGTDSKRVVICDSMHY